MDIDAGQDLLVSYVPPTILHFSKPPQLSTQLSSNIPLLVPTLWPVWLVVVDTLYHVRIIHVSRVLKQMCINLCPFSDVTESLPRGT